MPGWLKRLLIGKSSLNLGLNTGFSRRRGEKEVLVFTAAPDSP